MPRAGPWRVRVDRRVEKDLERAPDHIVRRLLTVLDELARDPLHPRPGFDSKRLQGAPGAYRLRIGSWRVLYDVDQAARAVRVTTAAPRRQAYR